MTIRSSDFGGGFDAWSPNKTYPPDKVVVSLLTGALCKSLNTVGPSATDPSNDSTNWSVLAGAPGTLKSVQRGVASGDGAITISQINPSKSIVTLYGVFGSNSNNTSTTSGPRVSNLTTTQLTIAGATYVTTVNTNMAFSWQIAEYY